MLIKEISLLMDLYPKIYLACHTKHVTDKDNGVKLTAKQASILDHLDMDKPITLFDLAMHMGVTPSTMSLSVDRVIKLGYIKKEKDKEDGRKTNLTLSLSGYKIKQTKSVLDEKRVKAVLEKLSTAQRKQALDGLALLAWAAEIEMKSKSLEKSWNNHKS